MSPSIRYHIQKMLHKSVLQAYMHLYIIYVKNKNIPFNDFNPFLFYFKEYYQVKSKAIFVQHFGFNIYNNYYIKY